MNDSMLMQAMARQRELTREAGQARLAARLRRPHDRGTMAGTMNHGGIDHGTVHRSTINRSVKAGEHQ